MKLVTTAFAAAVLSLGLPAAAQTTESVVHFQGSDGNWFNPANWSGGRVPGAEDDVQLDGDDHAVIDATIYGGGTPVQFRDLIVRDHATFEVLNGSVVQSRDQLLYDQGRIIYRSSGDVGENLIVAGASEPAAGSPGDCSLTNPFGCALEPPGPGQNGILFNPTSQSKRTYVLKSSVTLDMGLGGTTAAGVSKVGAGRMELAAGRGHYATLVADTLVLDGELRISTYYDFRPRPGDRFQIMTVNRSRSGEFIGVPEGGYVGCTGDHVGLRLSYRGGDGNDLVLSAENTSPALCMLLPAVQKIRQSSSGV